MKLKSLKLVPVVIAGGAIALACFVQGFLGRFPGFQLFQRLEWITYDWRLRVAKDLNPPASEKLGFVHIGDETLALFSQGLLGTNLQFGLKWPRHIYGRVVRELKAQGATAVGLDIFFSDRRPDHGAESDVFFGQQLQLAGNVVLGATPEVIPDPYFRAQAAALGDLSREPDADGVLRRAYAFHDCRLWHPAIQRAALLEGWDLARARVQSNQVTFPKSDGGAASVALNADGYFAPSELNRNGKASSVIRLYRAFEPVRVWHLGLALAARELKLDLDKADVQLDRHRVILSGSNGVTRVLPVDRQGRFLIDWSLGLQDKRLTKESFESLVAKDIERSNGANVPARFAGKLVVVGSTATGNELTDRGATPLEKDTTLTSNYCNVINSVLTGRFLQPTSLAADCLMIALLGLGAVALSLRLPAGWASGLVLFLVAGWVTLALFATVRYLWWLPIVTPVGTALFAHAGLLTYQTFFEQNERRRIKTIFTKLVSPNIVNELLNVNRLSLIGARGEVTVFFADVRGFTEMTDRRHAQAEAYVRDRRLGPSEAKIYFDQQAQDVLHTVNIYLGLIADVIKRHDGTLDKYIGDCVMAFWGAPAPNPRHALLCVRAAIDAQRAIYQLNQQRAEQNKHRELENVERVARGQTPLAPLELLTLGTGINTGLVTVGLMGSDAHGLNYTVFGRDVNLASRLETHSGRGRIIISEATHRELLRDDPALAATCVPLPAPKLKGFETAVNIFEVRWKAGTTIETELVASSALPVPD